MAMDLIDKENPDFVIGSPPCTAFCTWNQCTSYTNMDKERVAKFMADGHIHLEFMAKIYRKQMSQGRHVVNEQPAAAVPWDERAIVKLMADP